MQHLEGSGTPVLYIGRTVLKGYVERQFSLFLTMKITNKLHYIDEFIIPSRLYMFGAMFSPIIRST